MHPADTKLFMQSFQCQNGTIHPRSQTKQLAEGNDCIKITIRLDYWRKVPVIDERGTRRLASWHRKLLELSLDLLDHFPSNLALALDLNYEIAHSFLSGDTLPHAWFHVTLRPRFPVLTETAEFRHTIFRRCLSTSAKFQM